MSRGLRSPARDSLLASLTPRGAYGRAFGVERAGDNLGAVAGPLLAAALVGWVGIRPAMYLAALPGLLAAVAITLAAREARRRRASGSGGQRARLHVAALRRAGVVRSFIPIACFELGNVATTLLILRASQQLAASGRSVAAATSLAILIYALHNAFAAAIAFAGGHWVDRAEPRVVFAAAAGLYVVAYLGFAGPWSDAFVLAVWFVLAGCGIGLAETAESALVARLLPDHLRGSGFGVLGGVQSVGDLLASAVVGALYAAVSPLVAFAYAAGWMLVAVVASGVLRAARQPPSVGTAAT
jgi:MFS family permease